MSATKRKRKNADGTVREDRTYTIRFRWQGKQIPLQTGCESKDAALRIQRDLMAELRAGRIPRLLEQLRIRQNLTIGNLLTAYREAGCPDGDLQRRTGDSLAAETRHLDTLDKWWPAKNPREIGQADCDQYWAWRKGNVTRGRGDRTTELELNTLSNCLNWAVRGRQIDTNRIAKRARYRDSAAIVHCRDLMPLSGDELHSLAGKLLESPRSEVLGLAYLLEAFTGLRSEEVRQLRADAQRLGTLHQPGYIDEKFLYVARCKHGINPQIRLDDPDRPNIRPLLDFIRHWRSTRFPKSDWLLPGRGGAQLSPSAVGHALLDVTTSLKLPKRTPHGARAYYVTCRRAQGISDGQIADELGQSSGPELIRDVYGQPPPHWRGLANTFTWLPAAGPAAWDSWLARQPANVIPMPSAVAI